MQPQFWCLPWTQGLRLSRSSGLHEVTQRTSHGVHRSAKGAGAGSQVRERNGCPAAAFPVPSSSWPAVRRRVYLRVTGRDASYLRRRLPRGRPSLHTSARFLLTTTTTIHRHSLSLTRAPPCTPGCFCGFLLFWCLPAFFSLFPIRNSRSRLNCVTNSVGK